MHLKQVHMENFKSFGRKLTVPFEQGYTGITGPNGSGKSNIGDAILFVLGPNSPRAIRAGRLTDLIFNGGQHGKASSYCLVSLTFDNRDRTMPVEADEVTLTRKVRRRPNKDDPDGYVSNFYVNDRASKKREFVDLLNHARISADGYNITQQGDVLRICQMSNVERRKILDDIAGVTAFDKDIDQANARRSEVEANLERIGIVLDEIAGSLKRLEREKEAATKYKSLQTGIQRTKGLMALRRRDDVASQITQVRSQLEQFTGEREKLDGQLGELKARYKETQQQFAEAEQKIREEGGEEARKLQDQIEQVRDRLVRMEEKINYARMELQGGAEDLLPIQDELRRVQKELGVTRKVQTSAASEAEESGALLAARRKELDGVRGLISQSDAGAMNLNRELAQLKQEHERGQLELHEVRLELDRLRERHEGLERSREESVASQETVDQDLKEVTWQLGELEGQAQGSGAKRKQQERRLFDLRKAQAELTRQNDDLEHRIRRLQRELAELQARQEAAERVGGFGRSVQVVMDARDRGQLKGVIGTIADLASADERYQTALQTAAGGRMQAVVVEDDSAAAACIEFLKQQRAGRATFLPLNKMVPGRPRGQALMKVKQPGCVGFALDLIDFNPRYQNAFWYVFGDTLVAEDMGAGRRLMGGVRIVTVGGELFEASGAMVGGSQGRQKDGPGFSNQDRSRVDELLGEIQQAEAAQEDALERLSEARSELSSLEGELQDEGREGASSQQRLEELQRRRDSLGARAGQLVTELDKLGATIGDSQRRIDEAASRGSELETRLAELESLREEKGQLLLKGTKKELRERVEALERDIADLLDRSLKAENRRDVAAKQVELVDARRAELERAIEEHGRQRERLQDDQIRYTEAYDKGKAELDALMRMERKATGALKQLQDARDKCYQDLVNLKSKMDKIADRMETHYSLISNAKAKLPALEEELGEAMLELKSHPVELEADEVVPAADELRRQLRNLEAQLDRLGAVNMRALEEWEEQVTRQSGLQAEVERLQSQRTELIRLVEEITLKKKGALTEVFVAIDQNFQEVYARLSLGGKAKMELENPEDPFTAGLILKAQPMGKRVTRLDALSGGEKSLTSMAFIFAIQQYEPSPFYYLDEVDQNLDAVNSELLAKLVRDNSRFAQFIQVSLRKITLKEASHIYGVTQQVPGQSEVIANFDIDNLREEDDADDAGDEPADVTLHEIRTDGSSDDDGDDADSTISGTLQRMMQVEVRE